MAWWLVRGLPLAGGVGIALAFGVGADAGVSGAELPCWTAVMMDRCEGWGLTLSGILGFGWR
jgi:hypothetical protein